MKKIVRLATFIFMLSILLIPFTNSISAEGINKVKKENIWSYKGIKITVVTDHELSKEEKRELEKNFERKNNKKEDFDVTTNYIPADGDASTVGGPVYRTFNNIVDKQVIRYAVDLAGSYVAKIIGALKWSPIAGATTDYFQQNILDVVSNIPNYTYWGFWQTKSYSSYYGYYMYYNTEVQYKYSNYTSAMAVYYYDTRFHD
ncbi:hypothetical protein [Tepidibacillus marianensis]|uniref:hypothetical protein n=1 Tax=Tepidibacillus marianensis TaxID=3131995 RepID=UPI0030CAEB1E